MSWLTDEILFYGGMIVAGISALTEVIYFCMSKMRAVTLKAQLDVEYGKNEK